MIIFKDPTLGVRLANCIDLTGYKGDDLSVRLSALAKERPYLLKDSYPIDDYCIRNEEALSNKVVFVSDPECINPVTGKKVETFLIHRLYDVEIARHHEANFELDTGSLQGEKLLVSSISDTLQALYDCEKLFPLARVDDEGCE